MNKVELLGRPTREPEIIEKENDNCIAKFTLAVARKYKRDEADYISCVAFGKVAEIIKKYVGKGRQVCVAGRIQTGKYTNKDGKNVYTADVVIEDIDLCGSKNDVLKESPPEHDGGFMQIDEEQMSLPFN